MINTKIVIKYNHLPQIAADLRPNMSQVVRKVAFDYETEVKMRMRAPKSGRTYARGSRVHQASAPGEAPAVDLGQLINSIQTKHETDLRSTIGTNVEYAMPLEFGSRRIAPRPVWRPVADKLRPVFQAAITAVLRRLR